MFRYGVCFSLCALFAIGVSQLVFPKTNLPALSENFRLVAHVTSPNITNFSVGIENWEVVAMLTNSCDSPLILKRPSGQTSQPTGTVFYFDPPASEIRFNQGLGAGRLTIPDQGPRGREVTTHCIEGTPNVGVAYVNQGPQLVYAPHSNLNGSFYVCPREKHRAAVAELLYRDGAAEALPDWCVDVVLYAKRADGEHRREDALVPCCNDVKDGICAMPPAEYDGIADSDKDEEADFDQDEAADTDKVDEADSGEDEGDYLEGGKEADAKED